MKTFRFLLLLYILPLLITTCSKKEDKELNPDLTKNAFYINNNDNEYLLADGFVANSGGEGLQENYDYNIFLYSSGISFDTSYSFYEGYEGVGDAISMEITTDSWDGPKPGTYSTDNEEGEQRIEDIECYINYNTETWEASHMYYFSSAIMILQKEGDEYEITINASGVEFNEDEEIINDKNQMAAHFKAILPEYYFMTEDPSKCSFNADTIDFTFGIDYDHPEKYLIPGEQSDLSVANLEMVRSAVGTPGADIAGIMQVCHWVNQNFTFDNAGGAMIGVNSADELFEDKIFYGCHSLALIISSILREFGIPAVMIETADVQWGYDFRSGQVEYFTGHVMSELYIDNKWILFDNNCTYVDDYDHANPYISVMNSNEAGLFVFAKGVDIWDYSDGEDSFTHETMMDFASNLSCYEDMFYTVDYEWND